MLPKLYEFVEILHEIIGLYYSCYSGFAQNFQTIETSQQNLSVSIAKTIEELDKIHVTYADGPLETNAKPLYATTQGEYKANNTVGGRHHITIGNMIICQIYSYWEDYYRQQLANDLKIDKNKLLSDIFGDLRILRTSIVHHRAIALPEITRCKHLKWFKEGDEITITFDMFKSIIELINLEIDSIRIRLLNG